MPTMQEKVVYTREVHFHRQTSRYNVAELHFSMHGVGHAGDTITVEPRLPHPIALDDTETSTSKSVRLGRDTTPDISFLLKGGTSSSSHNDHKYVAVGHALIKRSGTGSGDKEDVDECVVPLTFHVGTPGH